MTFVINRPVRIMTKEGSVQISIPSKSENGTADGENNEDYIKEKDDDYLLENMESDNVAIRIPLLSSTIVPEVTNMVNMGSRVNGGGGSLPKEVRIIVPSDSDEDGPDFV